jgi:hypothetical protein
VQNSEQAMRLAFGKQELESIPEDKMNELLERAARIHEERVAEVYRTDRAARRRKARTLKKGR